MGMPPELTRHRLFSACTTQHFDANCTENAKPMSTATRDNDQRTIIYPETDWAGFLTGLGQEILAQQWCRATSRNGLTYFD
jgi:hypothetical protein